MSDSNRSSIFLSIVSGVLLLGLVFFAVGFVVAHFRVFPYAHIREVVRIADSLIKHGTVIGEGRRFEAPAGSARELAVVHDAGAAMGEGHYALLAWDSGLDSYSVRLHDAAGALVHVWPIDEMSFSDKPQHRQNAPHAMEVLADGSLLISFDWVGLVARLDACGDALWVRDGYYHHSFAPSADGGIWTWYGAQSAYGQKQDILKFDPETGEDMVRISFTDIITRSPETALLFSMYPDFPFAPDVPKPRDIFHPNDVEELLPELAPAFPQFEAGDLMLSIRELDMVAIISQAGDLKWIMQGPWLKQHDPDFEPDGRISIFDNSRDRPHSMIMTVDPITKEVVNALPNIEKRFKTKFRGKHQRLPNGNRLITVPEQGQALEYAPSGKLVVEFNNVAADLPEFNEDLVNAKWLPAGFFETMPSCQGQ